MVKNMKFKTMYAVEHYYINDLSSTFEIFESFKDAQYFCDIDSNWNENHFPLYIFKAKFNCERIFMEDDGIWNYDDYSDTFNPNTFKVLKEYNTKKNL